jgi:curved DNA-binding protein CbpA
MIKKIEDMNYYELLEINTDASSQDIHRAYERIRKIYEPNSIALYSLFSAEETTAINQRIEDAYRTLVYEESRKRYDALLRQSHGRLRLPRRNRRKTLSSAAGAAVPVPGSGHPPSQRAPSQCRPLPTPMPVAVMPTPQPLPSTVTDSPARYSGYCGNNANYRPQPRRYDETRLALYRGFIEAENFSKLLPGPTSGVSSRFTQKRSGMNPSAWSMTT